MNNPAFKFRFENEPFFNRNMNGKFSSKEDIINYFKEFFKLYQAAEKEFEPISKKRMQGAGKIKNYTEKHYDFNQLETHYGLLLTIGKNGFDIWLNDYKS